MKKWYVVYRRRGNFSSEHAIIKGIHPIEWISQYKDTILDFFCEVPDDITESPHIYRLMKWEPNYPPV